MGGLPWSVSERKEKTFCKNHQARSLSIIVQCNVIIIIIIIIITIVITVYRNVMVNTSENA